MVKEGQQGGEQQPAAHAGSGPKDAPQLPGSPLLLATPGCPRRLVHLLDWAFSQILRGLC